MLEGLPVHQPAKWPRRFRNAARQEAANFVEKSTGELLIDAPRDTLRNSGRRQPDGESDAEYNE